MIEQVSETYCEVCGIDVKTDTDLKRRFSMLFSSSLASAWSYMSEPDKETLVLMKGEKEGDSGSGAENRWRI